MEITLLGTGGMMPLKDRFLTSLYVEHEGHAMLIDCGEGTQVAIAACGLKLSRIEAMFLTHRHVDHVGGLPGLLLSLANTGRTDPLPIHCGPSVVSTVRALVGVTGGLPFPIDLKILPEDAPAETVLTAIDPMFTVRSVPMQHRVPCLGYRITLARKPVFAPEKAKALDVPVPFWSQLHAGETVTLPDGRSIVPADVTGAARPPIVIAYTTDTLPLPHIVDLARDADLFIGEGMYGDLAKRESMDDKHHMLMQDSCRIAMEAGAKRLWLTHYSPAEKGPMAWKEALEAICPFVHISQDGDHIQIK